MEFSETTGHWQPIPPWVRFLIDFGFGWPRKNPRPRRIAIVSMPCDSAAAGLIMLGALIRDLAIPDANDVDGHYEKLLMYARQYLESCADCEVPCDPQSRQCGYSNRATGQLRSPPLRNKILEISDQSDLRSRIIRLLPSRGHNQNFLAIRYAEQAKDYHVEGDPPVIQIQSNGKLLRDVYEQLVEGAELLEQNLVQSYSGLCIAGRAAGEVASREVCSRIKFSNGVGEFSLDGLLTVHEWSDCSVSRVAYFNSRTGRMDRNAAVPHMVVADGDASFLKAADCPEFQQSDLVGVIQRTVERDSLEAVGAKITAWRQWYDFDEETLYGLPPVPRGISISVLKRRT